MKATQAQQQALIGLLNRFCDEIRPVEEQHSIRAGTDDYRPRIEYFHDAVRALSSGATGSSRLSVEMLAYDISMLRHIEGNPMGKAAGTTLSPGTSLITQLRTTMDNSKINLSMRDRLAELYKNYTVLFVALLSDTADRNYQHRTEEKNNEVEVIYAALKDIEERSKGRGQDVDLESLLASHRGTADPALKALPRGPVQAKKRLSAAEALQQLRAMKTSADKTIKTLEQAHFTYATGQLAIYEGAMATVKKMAMQGMNIVGEFVEGAVAEAMRNQRGR